MTWSWMEKKESDRWVFLRLRNEEIIITDCSGTAALIGYTPKKKSDICESSACRVRSGQSGALYYERGCHVGNGLWLNRNDPWKSEIKIKRIIFVRVQSVIRAELDEVTESFRPSMGSSKRCDELNGYNAASCLSFCVLPFLSTVNKAQNTATHTHTHT